jgi:DNA-binding NarL/FixJ family response regulator
MTQMKPISLLLVDDQQLFREGLALILKQHYPTVKLHHAGSGPEALRILKIYKIDIILLDIGMPEMNGVEAAQLILKDFPETKILVLTQYHGEAMIMHLVQIGVHGFLFKNSGSSEICLAIEKILSGEQFFPASISPTLIKKTPVKLNPTITFNKREAEILLFLKMGRSSKEIAERMNLKENTVNSYREDMLQKTKTRNVAELISYAYQNGVLG